MVLPTRQNGRAVKPSPTDCFNESMSFVKVKAKCQVTLPNSLLQQVRVDVGDVLEAKVRKGRIILTPKSVVDRGIAESLEDFKRGRTYGPFDSAEGAIRSLHRNVNPRC
jgi:bifunctional DNA-binding transcriptional regulator/antitoxin component of YhaV-PrlF toxin-antitoxin module